MTDLEIRFCRREELRSLEWAACLRADRDIIEWVYERSRDGQMTMLVAVIGLDPVGQIWIDYMRKPGVGVLWALRVKPGWQLRGFGTFLITSAERHVRYAGLAESELGVEPENDRARRMYESLGYRHVGREVACHAITGASLGYELDLLRWHLRQPRPNRSGRLGPPVISKPR